MWYDQSGSEENFPKRTYNMKERLLKITDLGRLLLLVDSGSLRVIARIDSGSWIIKELEHGNTYSLLEFSKPYFDSQSNPANSLYLQLDSIDHRARVIVTPSLIFYPDPEMIPD